MADRKHSLLELFSERVSPEPNTGCWLWGGSYNRRGTGRVKSGGVQMSAMVASWRLSRGTEPTGDVVSTCGITDCVRPDHLVLRGPRITAPRGAVVGDGLKVCQRCRRIRPISEYKGKANCPHCREYDKRYQTEHFSALRLKAKEQLLAAIEADPKRFRLDRMLGAAKRRAKLGGVPYHLAPSDLMPLPEVCPVLGIELDYGSKLAHGGFTNASPSLDRLDNSRGYVAGNVWVISMRANRLKSDATLAELEQLVRAIKRMRQARLRLAGDDE